MIIQLPAGNYFKEILELTQVKHCSASHSNEHEFMWKSSRSPSNFLFNGYFKIPRNNPN